MTTSGRFHSISSVGNFLGCPRRYYLSYIERRKVEVVETPVFFRRGSAVHKAFEVAYQTHVDKKYVGTLEHSRDEALAALATYWHENDIPDGGDLDSYSKMVDECLPELSCSWEDILGIECRLKGNTPDGSRFIGFVDLLLRVGDDAIEIRDYKTKRQAAHPDDLEQDQQGCMYAHFAMIDHPWAKKAYFSHYYPPIKKLVRVELSPASISAAVERHEASVELIEAENIFAPRLGSSCEICSFTEDCPARTMVVPKAQLEF